MGLVIQSQILGLVFIFQCDQSDFYDQMFSTVQSNAVVFVPGLPRCEHRLCGQ